MQTLLEACQARDVEYLAQYFSARQCYPITPDQIRLVLAELPVAYARTWTESPWSQWIVERLRVVVPAIFAPGGQEDPTWLVGELHVFFAHIDEPWWMRNRLSAQEPLETPQPARSRISSTSERIHPIDSLAARVCPVPVS